MAWFKNAESQPPFSWSFRGEFFGVDHLVHVAIPESRGQHVRWDNFLTTLPPGRIDALLLWKLGPTLKADSASHIFATSEGAGTAILTFLGGFHLRRRVFG
jgi:photosystem I P700 chlorophyll a apoprotein A2